MQFVGDDDAYLDWVARNPNGYVLNLRAMPDRGYVVLHRASCRTINSRRDPLAYTGRGYRKACGIEAADLEKVAVREGRTDGSYSKKCQICNP